MKVLKKVPGFFSWFGGSLYAPNWVDFDGSTALANTSTTMPADAPIITVFFRLRQAALTPISRLFLSLDVGSYADANRTLQITTQASTSRLRALAYNSSGEFWAANCPAGANELTVDTDQDVWININTVTDEISFQVNDATADTVPHGAANSPSSVNISAVTKASIGGTATATLPQTMQMSDMCVYNADVPMSAFRAADGSPLRPPTANALVYFGGDQTAIGWNAGTNLGSIGNFTPVSGFVSDYPFHTLNWIDMGGESMAITNAASLTTINHSAGTPADADLAEFTLAAWLDLDTFSGATEYIMYAEGATQPISIYRGTADTRLSVALKDSAGAVVHNKNLISVFPATGVCHFVLQFKQNDHLTCYINGGAPIYSETPAGAGKIGMQAVNAGIGLFGRFSGTNQVVMNSFGSFDFWDSIIPIEQLYTTKSTGSSGDVCANKPPGGALISMARYSAKLLDVADNNEGSWPQIDTITGEVTNYGWPQITDVDETGLPTGVVNSTPLTGATVVTNPYESVAWAGTYYRHRVGTHDHWTASSSASPAATAAWESAVALGYQDQGYDFMPFMHYSGDSDSAYGKVNPGDTEPDGLTASQRGNPWRSTHVPSEWLDYDTPGISSIPLTTLQLFTGAEDRPGNEHVLRWFHTAYLDNSNDYNDVDSCVAASLAEGGYTVMAHPFYGIGTYMRAIPDAMAIHNGHYYYNTRYWGQGQTAPTEDANTYDNLLVNWSRMVHYNPAVKAIASNDRYGGSAFGAGGSIRLAGDHGVPPLDQANQSPAMDSGKIEVFSATDDLAGVEAAIRAGSYVPVLDTEAVLAYGLGVKNNYPQIDLVDTSGGQILIETVAGTETITWYVGKTGRDNKRFAYAKIDNLAGGVVYTQAFVID